ncbi:MAG TPA: dipeptidase PepE [Thermoanaerobaculia bacterium]|jgi:dipeptidase E|nr:dipeptidase PepE [Thermoanaerobaculia bacterium]
MSRRLLLVSNSTNHGQGYLDHVLAEIDAFLGPVRRLVFVPFALRDRAAYGAKAGERLAAIGVEVATLTADEVGRRLAREAGAVFTGGGNTFRLLKTLQDSGLLEILRERARAGMPYLGSSAGTNIAAPTIRTTNDMPIVQPASFEALRLVPFQINPHYLDPDPGSTHMGETREQRIREFHEENEIPVVGLREGAWIRVEGDQATLGGNRGARIFRRGLEPEERGTGESLDDLL